MWPRVNQISRTLLFHTHFSQIRYQIKANSPTHMAKQTELFWCLTFLNKSILSWWGETFLGELIPIKVCEGWYVFSQWYSFDSCTASCQKIEHSHLLPSAGLSTNFYGGSSRAWDSSKSSVCVSNEHHCTMRFCVFKVDKKNTQELLAGFGPRATCWEPLSWWMYIFQSSCSWWTSYLRNSNWNSELSCAPVVLIMNSPYSFFFLVHLICRGEIIAKAETGETIIYADIDLDRMEEVRQNVPLRHQKRHDLYEVKDLNSKTE